MDNQNTRGEGREFETIFIKVEVPEGVANIPEEQLQDYLGKDTEGDEIRTSNIQCDASDRNAESVHPPGGRGRKNKVKLFKCEHPHCKKTFKSKKRLNEHILLHSGKKSFNKKSDSSGHEKVHKEEKIFKCSHDDCQKIFKRKNRLIAHQKTHLQQIVSREIVVVPVKEDSSVHNQERGGKSENEIAEEKAFKCHQEGCEKTFVARKNLNRHLLQHSDDKKFKCTVGGCGEIFDIKSNLTLHLRTHAQGSDSDGDNELFVCDVSGCDSRFLEKRNYNKHMLRHKHGKRFSCTVQGCDVAFYDRRDLKQHSRKHTGERISCDFEGCNKTYTRQDSLAIHKRTHTKEIKGTEKERTDLFKCKQQGCNQTFSKERYLNRHLIKHNDEKLYKCSEEGCERAFKMKGNLISHMKIHSLAKVGTTDETALKACTYPGCKSILRGERSFYNHIQRHKVGKRHRCTFEQCKAAFYEKRNLLQHMTIHTGKQFVCQFEQCGKSYTRKDSLMYHQQTHSDKKASKNQARDVKIYKCSYDECRKEFSIKRSFFKHLLRHKSENKFKCTFEDCDREYNMKSMLQSHLKTHSGDHDVVVVMVCSYPNCDSIFKEKRPYYEHMKKHRLGKRFPCTVDQCKEAFYERKNLLQHLRKHANERFVCPHFECKKSYSRKDGLTLHLRSHNSDVIDLCTDKNCNEKSEVSSKHFENHNVLLEGFTGKTPKNNELEELVQCPKENETKSSCSMQKSVVETSEQQQNESPPHTSINLEGSPPDHSGGDSEIALSDEDTQTSTDISFDDNCDGSDSDDLPLSSISQNKKNYSCAEKSDQSTAISTKQKDETVDTSTNQAVAVPNTNHNPPKGTQPVNTIEESYDFENDEVVVVRVCNYTGCGATFLQYRPYYEHMRRHKLGKRFLCTFENCNAAFYENKQLQHHLRFHTGERYICDFENCKKSYTRKDSLVYHQKMHSKTSENETSTEVSEVPVQKPFRCHREDCEKSFITRKNLNRHLGCVPLGDHNVHAHDRGFYRSTCLRSLRSNPKWNGYVERFEFICQNR